jgi:DNA-binding transcriptional MerR regulator
MELLSIGTAARRFGLKPSALRYYDDLGLLPPAKRRGGRRLYDHAALERLALIRLLTDAGVRLDAVGRVFARPTAWRSVLEAAESAVTDRIRRDRAIRAELRSFLRCQQANPRAGCPILPDLLARGGRTSRAPRPRAPIAVRRGARSHRAG